MGQKNIPQGFLCVINENFLRKSEEYLQMCNQAIKANRPMYVLIKEGTNWDEFKQFPWRMIMFFDTENEFDENIKKVRLDLKLFNQIGGT